MVRRSHDTIERSVQQMGEVAASHTGATARWQSPVLTLALQAVTKYVAVLDHNYIMGLSTIAALVDTAIKAKGQPQIVSMAQQADEAWYTA